MYFLLGSPIHEQQIYMLPLFWLPKFSQNLGLKCKFECFLRQSDHDFAVCSPHCNIDWRYTRSKIDETMRSKIMIAS